MHPFHNSRLGNPWGTSAVRRELAERAANGRLPIGSHQVAGPGAMPIEATSDEQAEITIALAEERAGRTLTADEIAYRAAIMRNLAGSLDKIAERRRAAEAPPVISLDEIEVTGEACPDCRDDCESWRNGKPCGGEP